MIFWVEPEVQPKNNTLIYTFCSFCLDAKSTKKIKAKPNAPLVWPGQRT